MTTLDYTSLRLTGALRIDHLTSLTLHVGVNDHGWSVVEGETGEDALEQLQGAVAGREQVIMARDESGVEQPLFSGIIRTAGLVTYGGYNRFHIELQTGTILMDQLKRSRSFQDVAQTYSQVAQRVASGYEDGAVIPTVGLDSPLTAPVIQYRETDWEFLKRMASWCGGVVVPESHYSYPRLWFGFPERAFTCTFPEDCYTSGISRRYYELGGSAAGYRRADFLYYDVPSSQLCDLGWYTVFKGQEFLICEKWAKLERGELTFTYRLGKPGLGWGRKQYNDKISGMTILGEVLSTERETVRLKLDIDEGWAPGGPYAYTWRPETGNMMYCMPQAGTRVSLYFPNYDEQAAMVVNCVRTNGASCARMSDSSKRSFVTEHGKEMNLYPEELSFLGGSNGSIKIADEDGISFNTDKKIAIWAKENVCLKAKTAVISAPTGEIVLARGDQSPSSTTTLIQSNQFDLLSIKWTHMEGWDHTVFSPYNDQPEVAKFDISVLVSNALGSLICGSFIILGIGLFALGGMVVGAVVGAVKGYQAAEGTNESVADMVIAGAVSGVFEGCVDGASIGADVMEWAFPLQMQTFNNTLNTFKAYFVNELPNVMGSISNVDKETFTTTVEAIISKEGLRYALDRLTKWDPIRLSTKYGLAPDLAYWLGFEWDEENQVYHTRPGAWQEYFGYNWMYDFFFDMATYMDVENYTFTYKGEKYVFWVWHGDYLNLGAGSELGFYKKHGDTQHYVKTGYLPMEQTMTYKGEELFHYAPEEGQWWMPTFDPNCPDPDVSQLTSTYVIDLSERVDMYEEMKRQFEEKEEKNPKYKDWTFNDDYTITLVFDSEGWTA